MMASGKVIRDYGPLMEYLRLLSQEEREVFLPSSRDIDRLINKVRGGNTDLNELLEDLTSTLIERVNHAKACEAIKRAWHVEYDVEWASKEIARELAGWIIELAEGLGSIRLRHK